MDPPWPTSVRPSIRRTCRPSPYAVQPGAEGSTPAGRVISSSVAGSSTSPVSPSRKAPNRARSVSVAHSCPAAAMTPAWCSGSARTTSAHGCTARPSAAGATGRGRGPVHAQRRQDLGGDGVLPRRPAQPRHQLAEQAEPQVGVVEPPGRPEDDVVGAEVQVGERAAGNALPPSARALGRGPGEVREQLADGAVAERRAGQVPVERVVEVQPALVPQAHHHDGGDGLADRAEPVLDVGVRLGDVATPGRPGQPAVPDDAGDEARRAPLALHAGGARQEDAGGGRQDGFRHAPDRSEPTRSPAGQAAGTASRTGSRPVREAQRSNSTVASGGTDAARASSVVARVPPQEPARDQGDDDVGHEDPAVDRPEDLDADLGGLRHVLDVHPGEQADPGEGLGDGDDPESGGDGAWVHAPILPETSAQVGASAG